MFDSLVECFFKILRAEDQVDNAVIPVIVKWGVDKN